MLWIEFASLEAQDPRHYTLSLHYPGHRVELAWAEKEVTTDTWTWHPTNTTFRVWLASMTVFGMVDQVKTYADAEQLGRHFLDYLKDASDLTALIKADHQARYDPEYDPYGPHILRDDMTYRPGK